LTKWCARYPQHRDALARFFATWAVQCELPEQTQIDEERIGNLLVSHALNVLHRQESAAAPDPHSAAVPRLCETIASSGLSEEEFGRQCSLDDSIIGKLNRRMIRPASIPSVCFERMAGALGRAVEFVHAMLSGEPVRLGSYKARARPEVTVEDFLEAVRASDLSEDAKSEWIRVVDAERGGEEAE
jgi:hypothetical protein